MTQSRRCLAVNQSIFQPAVQHARPFRGGFWLAALFWIGISVSGCDSRNPGASTGSNVTPPTGDSPVDDESANDTKSVARGPIWFREVVETSGIDFVHVSGDFSEKPFPAANGSGVAACDFDLDGLPDLYFATGSRATFDPQWTEHPTNECYRNLGDWKFEKITVPAGLEFRGYSAGIAVADFDSDGFPDIFVNCFGADCLFHNEGDGTFTDVSGSSGVAADTLWGTSAAFVDYDSDGLVDLYVANYAVWTMESNRYCGDRSRGVRTFCSPTTVEPAPHILYRNLGDGRFVPVNQAVNIEGLAGRGQGVLAVDINEDGFTDLYIANDLNPNFLLVANDDGRLVDRSKPSGTDTDFQGIPHAGMGIAVADTNRDGLLDLFVTNYEGEHNAFYENLGDGQFQDVSRSRGLAADSIPWVGWGTVFADFDQDGWPDCLVTNGHTDDNFQQMGRDSPYDQRPGLWRNDRGRFRWAGGGSAGAYFGQTHVGRGLATADFDRDGDLDVVIVHQNAPPALLRNDSHGEQSGSTTAVVLRLIGRQSNRDAIGATVRVLGIEPPQLACVVAGGSYESESAREIWLDRSEWGGLTAERHVSVRWPGGRVTQHLIAAGVPLAVIVEPTGEGE